MENIKVSIIIPVYNSEKYIEKAFKSVTRQTLKEKEILFIDDGSTDSSYNILLDYKERFSNIRIFRQNNMGAGKARNLGIKNAMGEFICFMDTDDFYISEDVLEHLYYLAKKENVNICGGCSCNYKNGKLSFSGLREERRFTENQYICKEDFPGMTGFWAYIYKKKFLLDNQIFFPDYIRGQDLVFFAKAISCSGGIFCSSKLVYVYRINHKKVKYDRSKALGIVNSMKDVLEIAIKNNMKNIQKIVCDELEGEIGALIYRYSFEGSSEMQSLIKKINFLTENSIEGRKILLENEELIEYMEENKRTKKRFIDEIKKISRIYIFGTGMVGKKIASFLNAEQIKICAYIVSNIYQECTMLDSIPVKEIDEIDKKNNDYIVIIATYWYSQKEIIEMLKGRNIKNFYPVDLIKFLLWQEVIEH